MRLNSSVLLALFVLVAGMFLPTTSADAHPRRLRHTHRIYRHWAPPARYFVDPFDRRYFFDPVTGRYVLRSGVRRNWIDDDDDDDYNYYRTRRWRRWH